MKEILITIGIIMVLWSVFVGGTVSITFSTKEKVKNIEINVPGFLWSALDRYSIWKYHSDDKPLPCVGFEYKVENKTIN